MSEGQKVWATMQIILAVYFTLWALYLVIKDAVHIQQVSDSTVVVTSCAAIMWGGLFFGLHS